MTPVVDPAHSNSPSGEAVIVALNLTSRLLSSVKTVPEAQFHKSTPARLSSYAVEARIDPSPQKARPTIEPFCPSSVPTRADFFRSQILITWSSPPDKTNRPS